MPFLPIFARVMENPSIIELRNTGFDWPKEMVVYVENSYDEVMNRYVRFHFKELCGEFQRLGYCFVYLPLLPCLGLSVRNYVSGYMGSVPCDTSSLWEKMASSEEERGQIVSPSLIWFIMKDGESSLYRCWNLQTASQPYQCFEDFFSFVYKSIWRRSMLGADQRNRVEREGAVRSLSQGELGPDEYYLLGQVHSDLQRIVDSGVSLPAIRSMIAPSLQQSRLLVTGDYRIIMQDFSEREIELRPIAKSLYLFYLQHPEGISLKHLVDYREELCDIYARVSGKWNKIVIRATISRLTDITDNSIYEKINQIKSAFYSQRDIDESILSRYIITGDQGDTRRITLDKHLVIWEQETL